MLDFLDRLREKSDDERRTIAFGVSFAVTFFIFVIWISSFFLQMGNSTLVVTGEDLKAQTEVAKSTPTPIESIRESAASISASIKSIRDLFVSPSPSSGGSE